MNISIHHFTQVIKKCRNKETSADPQSWSNKNPSYRQCLVTALLANEILGLDIYAEKVTLESGFHGYHYFNKDATTSPIRFCDEQFAYEQVLAKKQERILNEEKLDIITSRDPEFKKKYELLKQRFQTEITKLLMETD